MFHRAQNGRAECAMGASKGFDAEVTKVWDGPEH